MKRQSEELFFKYNTKPTQYDNMTNNININIPSDYSPIAGDIIEMFISENQNLGFLSYTARLLVYKPLLVDTDFLYDIVSISGRLANPEYKFEELDSAGINEKDGVQFFSLYAPEGKVVLFSSEATLTVNLIVHRSKASIDLYYL